MQSGPRFSVSGLQLASGFVWVYGPIYSGPRRTQVRLVLHQVKWVEDDGRERPIMYRAGMGDMVVPYGDPNPTHVRKNTYDANSDSIVRFPYRSGDLKATTEPEPIVEGIPSSHHWTRDIAFSPDGKTMFLSVGSGSNVAEGMSNGPRGGLDAWRKSRPLGATWAGEERRADVLAFEPDGKNQRIYATGLRNCSGRR